MPKKMADQKEIGKIEEATPTVGQAAVTRYYGSIGRGIEGLREKVGRSRSKEVYIYAINIKWPKRGSPQFFALVKAYTPEGPMVGFHGGYQLVDMLISLGERLDAEAIEWVKDEYPPEGWTEEMAFIHSQELNRE